MQIAEQLVREIREALADGKSAASKKEVLWAECESLVGKLAWKYTTFAPDLREDFLNEGYLKFEQVLQTFDPDRGVPFRGYLTGCVERHFHDKVRKKKDTPTEMLVEEPVGADLLEGLRDNDMVTRVRGILADLLPKDPTRSKKLRAFALQEFEGWSLQQIAEELQAPSPNAVAQWTHKVRKAFATEFAARYPEYLEEGYLVLA